jgi:hypothetical protein
MVGATPWDGRRLDGTNRATLPPLKNPDSSRLAKDDVKGEA